MPPGSWAAAQAECEDEQYRQSLSADTWAAISSRSPLARGPGPRSSTSVSSLSGRAVSGRYLSKPRIPGSAEFKAMCGMNAPYLRTEGRAQHAASVPRRLRSTIPARPSLLPAATARRRLPRSLMPRVGRLERRLDLVQVENHPFSRFGRETDACENLLELVVGPPAANVVGRLPDADDVERILTRGAVVAELTEGNGPSTLHDQRVPTVIHRLQFVDVADELRDEHCWHDARVEPKRTHMFRTLMPL